MSTSSEFVIANCISCGAPIRRAAENAAFVCKFCGVTFQQPAKNLTDDDQVESEESSELAELRRTIAALDQRYVSLVVRLLGCVFFLLILGLAIAIGGSVSFGVNGYVLPAVVCGVVGVLTALSGIIAIVFNGMKISQTTGELREQKQRYETRVRAANETRVRAANETRVRAANNA